MHDFGKIGRDMFFDAGYAENAKKHAEHAFRDLDYNCAESVLEALLLNCGLECPPALLSVANGFGRGMGEAGCACGALIGAVMASGIILNGQDNPRPSNPYCSQIAKKLHDAFKKRHGATCCRILHKHLQFDSCEQLEACASRTGQTAELAALIIAEAAMNTGQSTEEFCGAPPRAPSGANGPRTPNNVTQPLRLCRLTDAGSRKRGTTPLCGSPKKI